MMCSKKTRPVTGASSADGLRAERGTAARHAKIAGADYASYPTSAGLSYRGSPSG